MTRCTSPRCIYLVRATDGALDGAEWVCERDGLPVGIRTTEGGVRVAEKSECKGKRT
jgi:hypothetical protein